MYNWYYGNGKISIFDTIGIYAASLAFVVGRVLSVAYLSLSILKLLEVELTEQFGWRYVRYYLDYS